MFNALKGAYIMFIGLYIKTFIFYIMLILYFPFSWILCLVLRTDDKKYYTFKYFYKTYWRFPIEDFKNDKKQIIEEWDKIFKNKF